jgi:serine/threonine protein kinase
MPISRRHFSVIRNLAAADQGQFNEGILLVRWRQDNEEYVEKRIKRRDIDEGRAAREVRAMKQCSYKYICGLLASDLDYRQYGYGSLYMEHCELGSLATAIEERRLCRRGFREQSLWKVLWQMSLALSYLHLGVDVADQITEGRPQSSRRQGWIPILHRDIKPANIFLTLRGSRDGVFPTAVLGDFGCCIHADHPNFDRPRRQQLMTAFTLAFGPPEAPRFHPASDVYSVALVIHCMAQTETVPSRNSDRVRVDPLRGTQYSQNLGGILKEFLIANPSNRAKPTELPYLVNYARRRTTLA